MNKFLPYCFGILLSFSVHSFNDSLKKLVHHNIFQDPKAFMGQTYCYYAYQGIINPKEITPDLFATYVKGGSLTLDKLGEYQKWLGEHKDGIQCKKSLGKSFKLFKLHKNKKYAIFLNQVVIKDEGKDAKLTLTHELLHIAFAEYKDKRHKIKEKWLKLSLIDQNKFKENHPGYDFKNEKILIREFFSYSYEKNPQEGLKLLLAAKIKKQE